MNKPIIGVIKQRLTSQMLYLKLRTMFFIFPIMLKISPPSKEQCEEMLVALEALRMKLGVE